MRTPQEMITGEVKPVQAIVQRKKIENIFLPVAIDRIAKAIKSDNERIALDAAKWIAEMVLGKPRDPSTQEGDANAALILAETLRFVLENQNAESAAAPVIEGNVRILGETTASKDERDGALNTPEAAEAFSD